MLVMPGVAPTPGTKSIPFASASSWRANWGSSLERSSPFTPTSTQALLTG